MPAGANKSELYYAEVAANAAAQAMGKFGIAFRAGATAAWTGDGLAATPYASGILIVNDTTFTTLTGVSPTINDTGTVTALTAVTFPAGLYIPGRFSAITIGGGAVLIYLG